MPVVSIVSFYGFILAAGIGFQPASPPPAALLVLDGTGANPRGWGTLGGVAVAPDGREVAYISTDDPGGLIPGRANHDIWIKPVSGAAARRVVIDDKPPGIYNLAFSPDGRSLAFWTPDELRRVAVAGGRSTPICPARTSNGITWGVDNRIVFGSGSSVLRVEASGGTPETVLTLPNGLLGAI